MWFLFFNLLNLCVFILLLDVGEHSLNNVTATGVALFQIGDTSRGRGGVNGDEC